MTTIDVYRYKVLSNEHGSFVDTKCPAYATLEKIKELGGEPIYSSLLKIDELELSDQGFYHPR